MKESVIKRALAGSKADREKILLALEPLLISSINKYYYRPHIYEDLLQEGRLNILESFEDYDPNKGVHFLGFIKVRLKYFYLEMNYEKEEIPLEPGTNSPLDRLEAEVWTVDDCILGEDVDRLKRALAQLTDIESWSLVEFYINGKSMKEMAKERGVSYRTVVNNKAQALKKIRKIY